MLLKRIYNFSTNYTTFKLICGKVNCSCSCWCVKIVMTDFLSFHLRSFSLVLFLPFIFKKQTIERTYCICSPNSFISSINAEQTCWLGGNFKHFSNDSRSLSVGRTP